MYVGWGRGIIFGIVLISLLGLYFFMRFGYSCGFCMDKGFRDKVGGRSFRSKTLVVFLGIRGK